MNVYRPIRATFNDLRQFHSEDYVTFLQRVNVNNITNDMKGLMKRFDIGTNEKYDCPLFPNMYSFSQISAGGSINSAVKINRQEADICINFAGEFKARKLRAPWFPSLG